MWKDVSRAAFCCRKLFARLFQTAGNGQWLAKLLVTMVLLTPFQVHAEPEAPPETFFFALDPMVVNVANPGEANRYLKVSPVLVTRQKSFHRDLKSFAPVIKSRLLGLYSRESVDTLLANNGFDTLRAKSLAEVRRVVQDKRGQNMVTEVLFNEFVIQ